MWLLAGDEADELRDAFLDGFLSVLGDLSIGGERLLHDPANVRDRKKPVLLANVGARALIAALVVAASSVRTRRNFRHRNPRRRSTSPSQNDIVKQKKIREKGTRGGLVCVSEWERERERESLCACICVKERESELVLFTLLKKNGRERGRGFGWSWEMEDRTLEKRGERRRLRWENEVYQHRPFFFFFFEDWGFLFLFILSFFLFSFSGLSLSVLAIRSGRSFILLNDVVPYSFFGKVPSPLQFRIKYSFSLWRNLATIL